MKTTIAMVSIVLLAVPASAQTYLMSDQTKQLASDYRDCVVAEPVKLNAAKESVFDTVEVAKLECEGKKLSIALNVVGDMEEKFSKASSDGKKEMGNRSREWIDNYATSHARRELFRIRAGLK